MKKLSHLLRFVLLTAFIGTFGCTVTGHRADALAGFHFSSLGNLQSNVVVTEDYRNYIQGLSPEERRSAGPIQYFENEAGQHAVMMMIGVNNKVWRHVLIYDKNNMRIKTVKYVSGDYHS